MHASLTNDNGDMILGTGAYVTAQHMRYMQLSPSLRPCRHGHRHRLVRSTHAGMANGAVITRGCAWHMYAWVLQAQARPADG